MLWCGWHIIKSLTRIHCLQVLYAGGINKWKEQQLQRLCSELLEATDLADTRVKVCCLQSSSSCSHQCSPLSPRQTLPSAGTRLRVAHAHISHSLDLQAIADFVDSCTSAPQHIHCPIHSLVVNIGICHSVWSLCNYTVPLASRCCCIASAMT